MVNHISGNHSQETTHLSAPPPNFKVSVAYNVQIPIDVEEIYRTATDMMFVVTDYPLSQTWLERVFTSPIGPAAIYVSQNAIGKDQPLNTQHIIWGLNHVMLAITIGEKYCQTTASLKWDGVEIGKIEILPHRRQIPLSDTSSKGVSSQPNTSSGSEVSHFFDKDISISCVYGKKPVDKRLLYLTAMKAMGDAAEKGLDTACEGMLTTSIKQVTWKMIREPGNQVPVFKAGHSRFAAFSTIGKLVQDNRWQEIHTVMMIDKIPAAVGGFHQGLIAATA